MTDGTIRLSASGRAVLTLAATREDRLVPPPKLPVAAARQVVRSLINNGLLEEVAAATDDPAFLWRTGADGGGVVLRATGTGIDAVSVKPFTGKVMRVPGDLDGGEPVQIGQGAHSTAISSDVIKVAAPARRRPGLRRAAEAVAAAWEALDARECPSLWSRLWRR